MLRHIFAIFTLTFSSLALALGLSSPFNSEPEFLPADQAFSVSVYRDSNNQVVAHWDITDGYYLYKHQLKIKQNSGPTVSFVEIPAGEVKDDPYFGAVEVYHDELTVPLSAEGDTSSRRQIDFMIGYQGCAERGLCYPPQWIPMSTEFPATEAANSLKPNNQNPTVSQSKASDVADLITNAGFLQTIAVMFGLGLLLSFTPCVLPMIPIVSAIIVGSKVRGWKGFYYSLIYVFAMALTYSVIGALAGWFGTQLNLQASLQNPVILMLSAALFSVLALAMFGVFELRLPSALQAKLDALSNKTQSNRSRFIAIFIAGALATLIVSPCVSAPLAGVILYISANSDPVYGAWALFFMGLGMGTPLLLVGILGSTILPSRGEWLEDVKKAMGFGLVAMAIWLATRWLPLETHLLLWGLLALAISAYFLHRTVTATSHPLRWFIGLLTFMIAILQITGAALGNTNPLSPLHSLVASNVRTSSTTNDVPYYAKIQSLDALETIKKQTTMPIVVDLYADWCISCKIIEEEIFKSPEILPLLKQVAFVQVDVTDNSEQSRSFLSAFGLFGPPSMLFFDNKQQHIETFKLVGEPSKSEVLERISALLPSDSAKQVY